MKAEQYNVYTGEGWFPVQSLCGVLQFVNFSQTNNIT